MSWYENCTVRGPYAEDFKTTPRAWNKFEHPPPKGDNSNIRLIIRPTSFQAKHCKFTPRLQKWIVGPIFFTKLRAIYRRQRNCPWLCYRVVVMLFLKPVDSLGFPFLKKMVELELKRTLRTFARSLDVDNWFKRTAGMLGMRRWSWSGRGGWFVFVPWWFRHVFLGVWCLLRPVGWKRGKSFL